MCDVFVTRGEVLARQAMILFRLCRTGQTLLVILVVLRCTSAVHAQSAACCLPNGSCVVGTSASCSAWGGVFRDSTSTCQGILCVAPMGACCLSSGSCQSLSEEGCFTQAGSYMGDSTTCSASAMCPVGSCCLPTGGCLAGLSRDDCLSNAGDFQGFDTTCDVIACSIPNGACCIPGGICLEISSDFCDFFPAAQWLGPNTTCITSGCTSDPIGLCCTGALCQQGVKQSQCLPRNNVQAIFVSSAPSCNPQGNVRTPCCYADFNKDFEVKVSDIFAFLSAWFAGSPYAKMGGNAINTPTVQDIFSFLAAWFAGPC